LIRLHAGPNTNTSRQRITPAYESGAYPEITLTPQLESPNGLWRRLGYAIERGQRGLRTIRRPDGSEVSIDSERGRHTGEIEAARQELERLPHGESAPGGAARHLRLTRPHLFR